jgi:hypothetical protein
MGGPEEFGSPASRQIDKVIRDGRDDFKLQGAELSYLFMCAKVRSGSRALAD